LAYWKRFSVVRTLEEGVAVLVVVAVAVVAGGWWLGGGWDRGVE
jgi:hypothetical protein